MAKRTHAGVIVAGFSTVLLLGLAGWSPVSAGIGDGGASDTTTTSFVGCRLVASWDAEVIADVSVIVRDGRVESIVRNAAPPLTAKTIPCNGAYLAPGFWNSHIHLLDPPPKGDDGSAQSWLTERFARWGFVHLIDTGSSLAAALDLSRRVADGSLIGPSIRTTGLPLVAPNGTPFYVEHMRFPELTDAGQARLAVSNMLDDGVFAVKVMAVSLSRDFPLPQLGDDVLAAVVEVAHSRGALVLAHPTNIAGIESSLRSGADILLHTTPGDDPWSADLVTRMVGSGTALVPTLMLWEWEADRDEDLLQAGVFQARGRRQLAAFHAAGGTVLFGTDAGYMTNFDPHEEYRQMALAGMSAREILRSLTASPASRFSAGELCGCIKPGQPADFVLLNANPVEDVYALTGVEGAWRAGQEIYRSAPIPPDGAHRSPVGRSSVD